MPDQKMIEVSPQSPKLESPQEEALLLSVAALYAAALLKQAWKGADSRVKRP